MKNVEAVDILIAQDNLQNARTNHILHLILSLITAGLWIPIWILVAINNASKRGNAKATMKGSNTFGRSMIQVLLAIIVTLGIVGFISEASTKHTTSSQTIQISK